jgi:hypothetical protein
LRIPKALLLLNFDIRTFLKVIVSVFENTHNDAVYNNLMIQLKIVGTIFENTHNAAALLVLFIDRKSELEVNKVFVTLLKTGVCSVKIFTLVAYKV